MVEVARKLLVSPMIWVFAFLHVAYIVLMAILPRDDLLTLMNGLLFCVAISVVFTFSRDTLRIVMAGRVDREDYLLLGIVVAWTSVACLRAWVTVWRFLDRPPSWVDDPILGLFILWAILAGALMMTAPSAFKGRIPAKNWAKLGFTVCVGSIIAFIVIFLKGRMGL